MVDEWNPGRNPGDRDICHYPIPTIVARRSQGRQISSRPWDNRAVVAVKC
ncbi:hypothetical protein [Lyngbya sp. CCY1209]|nr:hypothetical protein [Lyngbya sp. CCY1209]MEB3886913.1 hypothetical protein [Lyngbya sp. CCY1209]